MRKAVSVVKSRTAAHETAIREFRLDQGGVRVGQPLRGFRGLLSGTPVWSNGEVPPMQSDEPARDAGPTTGH